MFVERFGPADADHVVLLHSANFTGRMWRPVADRLQDMHLIVPDLPGHGRSLDERFMSIEETAEAVADVAARTATGRQPHIVGVSLGAYIGLTLLIRNPSLAASAVLSGFHLGDMPNPRAMILLGDLLSPIASTAWFQRRIAGSLKIPPAFLRHEDFSRPRTNGRTIRAVNRAAAQFDAKADLDKIRTPTLALAGAREHPTILESLRIMDRRMAHGTSRVAPGLGHAWPLQDPDLFARTVRAWIRQEGLPSPLAPATAADAAQ